MEALTAAYHQALSLLETLSTTDGILASSLEADNYKRVWARDSIICGIAGLLSENTTVIQGLRQSLLTLAEQQNSHGIIPSNVLPGVEPPDISYGSLVGRVDANTWFVVGSCLYLSYQQDEQAAAVLLPAIAACRQYLKMHELNGKGWLYTPLSGNWADEFPVQGYTLYDNALRLWGESLWKSLQGASDFPLESIKQKTRDNFWPRPQVPRQNRYQDGPFEQALGLGHYCAQILPGRYEARFDAAGNALALLLFPLETSQKTSLQHYLETLSVEVGAAMIPAFWPPIRPTDWEWNLLKGNYSFDFKNHPHQFHNGGIWPVWMGWYCLGLVHHGLRNEAKAISATFMQYTEKADWDFHEFISSDSFQLAGKTQMGFTASGIVLMYHALNHTDFGQTLGL